MTRLGDFLIACILLAITLPLLVIVALAIKWGSPGPVLDRQSCIGRGGRRFRMLQFRTAVHDPSYAVPSWAPRPTPVGQFLWRTRIDALPRLIQRAPRRDEYYEPGRGLIILSRLMISYARLRPGRGWRPIRALLYYYSASLAGSLAPRRFNRRHDGYQNSATNPTTR
jgi:hypothetical protein